ncbi:MAG: hypothetical protein PHQ93_09190 [Sulfurimonas sp.]|uniref:hypothetical protein n=1 Tax=Sulfurimonas sp. TaxID=2022749 RepID=UPI002632432A|nr:hypothetical protein [Sulfurimonas sp.]MDD5401346.1 hypothetical protein [Sulfurimonas sp.]
MSLKYAGPKPIISHTGIEFDNNKEDKYVYINIATQILKSINHEYVNNEVYSYNIKTSRFSGDDLLQELKNICPNIDEVMKLQNHNVEDEINHNIKRVHENMVLSEADKIILENNIKLMHDYMIQRSINKKVYYCVIDRLSDMVHKTKISYIIVPMFQTFLHTLHSLQGSLRERKQPIESDIEIYKENGQLFIKLKIKHL